MKHIYCQAEHRIAFIAENKKQRLLCVTLDYVGLVELYKNDQ